MSARTTTRASGESPTDPAVERRRAAPDRARRARGSPTGRRCGVCARAGGIRCRQALAAGADGAHPCVDDAARAETPPLTADAPCRCLPRESRTRGSRFASGGSVGRRPERQPGRLHDRVAEDVVADAADDGADAERQRLADDVRAARDGELARNIVFSRVGDRAHEGPGDVRWSTISPQYALRATAAAGHLPGEVAHQVEPSRAEHHRHDEGAGAVGVVDRDAVHLGDRLGEQRASPRGTRRSRRRRARASMPVPTPGITAVAPDGGAAGGHGGEVTPLEDADDLRGRGIRMPAPDAADVREHGGPLHGEQPVDAAYRIGRCGSSPSIGVCRRSDRDIGFGCAWPSEVESTARQCVTGDPLSHADEPSPM